MQVVSGEQTCGYRIGVPVNRAYEEKMSDLIKLKSIKTLADFAKFLGYKESTLAYILYASQYTKKYIHFSIPKKNGGTREIYAPESKLKKLQKILAYKLQSCYEEIQKSYSNDNIRKKIAHGYRKKLSIETNAYCHRNKKFVLNLDLDNFFPSINFGRVYGFFIKDKNFCISPQIATVIAQIACYDNQLPQGAPTSPIVSNFIAKILDIHLLKLAKKYNLTYTRYADDLTFSYNGKHFPESIAFLNNEKWEIGDELKSIITKSGFSLNENKTRMHYDNSRQLVTGLVVNKKVNIKKEFYKKLRTQCCSLLKHGYFFEDKDKSDIHALKKLEGRLNFAFYAKNFENNLHKKENELQKSSKIDLKIFTGNNKFYDNKRYEKYSDVSLIKNLPAIHKLYAQFLLYKYFINSKKTLILCEGKTDNIYIKCAIDRLKSKLNFKHKLKFIPHSKILNLLTEYVGGTSKLKDFCYNYKKIMEKFDIKTLPFPLIIIVDNDKAGNEVFNIPSLTSLRSFVKFISPNLYVVKLPSSTLKDCSIEDYFDNSIKTFNGKTFNPTNQKCSATEFGKSIFATKVVLPHKDSIDFSKFEPLLKEINNIIIKHT